MCEKKIHIVFIQLRYIAKSVEIGAKVFKFLND